MKFKDFLHLLDAGECTGRAWGLEGQSWWCACCDAETVSYDDPSSGKWFNLFGQHRKIQRDSRGGVISNNYCDSAQVVVAICACCLEEHS